MVFSGRGDRRASTSVSSCRSGGSVLIGVVCGQGRGISLSARKACSSRAASRCGVCASANQCSSRGRELCPLVESACDEEETFTGRLAFRGPQDVKTYRDLFAMYEEVALFGAAARERIRAWPSG